MANCDLVMEDLESGLDCSSMMSGIKRVVFMRREDVATWPQRKQIVEGTSPMADNVTVIAGTMAGAAFVPGMTLKPGKRAFTLFSKEDAGSLVYEGQGEKYSRSQKATLNVYNPGFKKTLMGFITAVQNASMVMLCKTNQDEWHMIGDKDRGAVLETSNATSGQATGDANGAEMAFTWDTMRPQILDLGEELADYLCTVNSGTGATGTIECTPDTTDPANPTIEVLGNIQANDDSLGLSFLQMTAGGNTWLEDVTPDADGDFTATVPGTEGNSVVSPVQVILYTHVNAGGQSNLKLLATASVAVS